MGSKVFAGSLSLSIDTPVDMSVCLGTYHVRQGPGVTLGIERMTWVSEMRPSFWQCAILQCDTTRIGQDAPYGAMPKLIHPSIPGPWHAPFPSILENLAGPW